METICPKCSKYKDCSEPCYPVKEYLALDNLSVYEKSYTKPSGETITILFTKGKREFPQSTLSIGVDNRGDTRLSNREQAAFSTENENPFSSFQPSLKITGIFIDRFFNKFTFKDLAEKYDINRHAASNIYHNALKRVIGVLEAMDQGTKTRKMDQYIKQAEKRSGKLPKGQRWYLLNKLFGLMPSEIAEMEGLKKKNNSVRQLIIRVSDQLKAGELSLIEVTPEESAAAKSRLNAKRKKRRERHAKTNASK